MGYAKMYSYVPVRRIKSHLSGLIIILNYETNAIRNFN